MPQPLTRDDLERAIKGVKALAHAAERNDLNDFVKGCDYTVDDLPIPPEQIMAWGVAVGAVAALQALADDAQFLEAVREIVLDNQHRPVPSQRDEIAALIESQR